jgi:hypothetical protein
MPLAPTSTSVAVRRPSMAGLLIHVAIAPLLIAVWAMSDAGLPTTIHNLLTVWSGGPLAGMMQESLEKASQTWIRAGFASVILLIWLGTTVLAWRRWQKWARSQKPADGIPDGCWVIVTLQVAALALSLMQVDSLSRLGLPWRVQVAAPLGVQLGDELFVDWPEEPGKFHIRAGMKVGRASRWTTIVCSFGTTHRCILSSKPSV